VLSVALANGYLRDSGAEWKCDRGYESENQCVQCCCRAHIAFSGNDWTCDARHRRTGACVADDALKPDRPSKHVGGSAAAPGIGIGPVFLLDPPLVVPLRRVGAGDVGEELARFDDARRVAGSEMERVQESMHVSGERDVAEMTAMHRLLLDDPTLLLKVRRHRLDRLSAESAVRQGSPPSRPSSSTSPTCISAGGADVEVM
jgi:hypothetical protein